HGLSGAVTGRGRANHLGRTINIESVCVFGTRDSARRHQRRERHHVPIIIPDVILLDIPVAESLFTFSLEKDPPLPAEAVELIQKEAAQIRLHRLIHIRYSDALLQNFVSINVCIDLRRGRGELRTNACQLRSLPGCREKLLQILIEELNRSTTSVLEPE